MPIITGPITHHGVVIDLIVGVPQAMRRASQLTKSPIPADVPLRAVIDTGSALTGCSPRIFSLLGLTAIDRISISTPSTTLGSPHFAPRFEVSLTLVAGGTPHFFAEALVIEADCFHPTEGLDALIGRDVLNFCSLEYWGQAKRYQFAF